MSEFTSRKIKELLDALDAEISSSEPETNEGYVLVFIPLSSDQDPHISLNGKALSPTIDPREATRHAMSIRRMNQ
jgi:hypothetical protein